MELGNFCVDLGGEGVTQIGSLSIDATSGCQPDVASIEKKPIRIIPLAATLTQWFSSFY